MAQAIGGMVLLAGVIAHTIGMFGAHRAEGAVGYLPASWEKAAHWLCYVLIAGTLAVVALVLL